ncbi:MAG: DEAD/DEAH box helicase, partial [Oscillospiraceae bacterium]
LKSIREIKKDMEIPYPMERLLCGDVGVGKTEVALRAAFKAVMNSKQVAILVPTTVLAWQHYNTLMQRMENFPINIQLLSRFRTAKQRDATIRDINSGVADIVVGTHALIQKSVKFKDLGLVVIDEEQRFGVAHKEKLIEGFKSVDVLTLSATPIPRTLSMALNGIRDMSTIE